MKRIVVIAACVTTSLVIAIIGILIAVGVTGWKAAVKTANEAARDQDPPHNCRTARALLQLPSPHFVWNI